MQNPGARTAGWAALKENEIMSDQMEPLVVEVRGRVNALCCSLEERWRFLDGQSEHKWTIYTTHSESANPPLHKSAYGATGALKTGGSVTNISVKHSLVQREERGTLSLLWQQILLEKTLNLTTILYLQGSTL